MKNVKHEDCEPLAEEIIDLIKSQPAHIATGALIVALACYADTLPELRFPIGRALLIQGGRFTTTPAPCTYGLEHMPVHPTIN